MAENVPLAALEECKREFNTAMEQIGSTLRTTVAAPSALVDAFVKKFEQDFTFALTDQKDKKSATFPQNAWALTRTQVLLKVRAIAALAVSYALEEKKDAITRDHLKTAVMSVKPTCKTTTQPLKAAAAKARSRRKRLEYCSGGGFMEPDVFGRDGSM
jgi:hypothetical protein